MDWCAKSDPPQSLMVDPVDALTPTAAVSRSSVLVPDQGGIVDALSTFASALPYLSSHARHACNLRGCRAACDDLPPDS